MFGFIKNWFRKRNDEKKISERRPWSCPCCGSKIELRSNAIGFVEYEGSVRAVSVEDHYVCIGLKDRSEVEEYLRDIWPDPAIPVQITAKLPCGWTGLASDFPRKWS